MVRKVSNTGTISEETGVNSACKYICLFNKLFGMILETYLPLDCT